ncbi:gamma-glutamylcyclotransferase family protein [Gemmata sp.]|uniref:gamma-glutamylcyclotransferase family protein n=1 Tax=Gemmata sp. TaxID=1914242 RepID=UPI003F72728A
MYGTLKRGLRNHHLMAGQRFVADVVTEPRYRVIDLGPYPGMVTDAESGLAVRGELWAVDAECLAALDAFEGVPDLFVRGPVAVAGRSGDGWAYFWNNRVPAGAASGARWPLDG